MEFNSTETAVHANSISGETGSLAGEIDLYDELIAFAELSPEQQRRLIDRKVKSAASAIKPIPVPPEPQWVREDRAMLPVIEAVTPEVSTETAPDSAAVTQLESTTVEATQPANVVATEAEIIAAESEAVVATEPAVVDAEPANVAAPESANVIENVTAPESSEPTPRPNAAKGGSGPLSSFALPSNLVYNGALSLGVCLSCGEASGADDLFCIACGGFIDEMGSKRSFIPSCGECGEGISADEIFCPWCGASIAAD